MATMFDVSPAGAGVEEALSGLGGIIQQRREYDEEQAAINKQKKEQADGQAALAAAYRKGDPNEIYAVALQYPFLSATAQQGLGLLQDFQKQEAREFFTSVLSNPERAAELADARLQTLKSGQRDPTHTAYFRENLAKSPEEALKELAMDFAVLDTEGFNAYNQARTPKLTERDPTKDLVDPTGKVVVPGRANGSDTPAAMRTLEMRAQASGLTEGSPEYQEFMRTGGNPLRSGQASAISRAYDNGTVLMVLPDGTTEVKGPDGEVLKGDLRVDALRKAREEEVAFAADKSGAVARSAQQEKRLQDEIDVGLDAAQGVPTLRRALDLLNEVETGGFAGASVKAKQWLGVESADEGELSNNLGSAVLSQLKATFGSAFTEKEGARLERLSAGMGKSPEANKRILQQSLAIVERSANRAIEAAYEAGDTRTAQSIEDLLDFTLTDEGGQAMPKSASDNGVTQEDWSLMTPEQKALFK